MPDIKMILIAVYAVIILVVFVMYGIDKYKAKHDKWRIPEKTLISAAVFGILGGALGMLVFHHKVSKPKFAVGLPLIFLAETLLAAAVYIKVIR